MINMSDSIMFHQLTTDPVPVWLAVLERIEVRQAPVQDLHRLVGFNVAYRGTSIDRVGTVLRSGIDAEPSDANIYATPDFDKAWEYGGDPKVILCLDPDDLEPTVCLLDPDASAGDVAAIRVRYPHEFDDGRQVWLSRTPDPKPGYELPYGRWIHGDPLKALTAIFIFATAESFPMVKTYFEVEPPTR